MRGRGISFHGPVNSGEAGGHRSKPENVPASGMQTKAFTTTEMSIPKTQQQYGVQIGALEQAKTNEELRKRVEDRVEILLLEI